MAGSITSDKIGKLVRMANQIGDFYAAMADPEATAAVASHLRAYWAPKMIRELVAFADAGGGGLNPTALRAVEALRHARQA